jgi:hypothetical protein
MAWATIWAIFYLLIWSPWLKPIFQDRSACHIFQTFLLQSDLTWSQYYGCSLYNINTGVVVGCSLIKVNENT